MVSGDAPLLHLALPLVEWLTFWVRGDVLTKSYIWPWLVLELRCVPIQRLRLPVMHAGVKKTLFIAFILTGSGR